MRGLYACAVSAADADAGAETDAGAKDGRKRDGQVRPWLPGLPRSSKQDSVSRPC